MSVISGPDISKSGLVLLLDAGNTRSYPGSGTTWNDLSSTKNNGGLVGSPTYNSSGYVSLTQATAQQINVASSTSLYFLGNAAYSFTIACRVTTYPGASSWRRLVHRENNVGAGRDGYNLWITGLADGTSIQFYTERWASGVVTSAGVTVAYASYSDWNIWTVTYDGTNLRLYNNGKWAAGTTSTGAITNNSTSFAIGNSGGGGSFGGDISFVSVHSRALSDSEVQQNFNAIRGRYSL